MRCPQAVLRPTLPHGALVVAEAAARLSALLMPLPMLSLKRSPLRTLRLSPGAVGVEQAASVTPLLFPSPSHGAVAVAQAASVTPMPPPRRLRGAEAVVLAALPVVRLMRSLMHGAVAVVEAAKR